MNKMLSLSDKLKMNRYYCPYCSKRYQFHKQGADGTMICGQCGDPLLLAPLIKVNQIFSLILVIAFISPMIVMIFFIFKQPNKQQINKGTISLIKLPIKKGLKYFGEKTSISSN